MSGRLAEGGYFAGDGAGRQGTGRVTNAVMSLAAFWGLAMATTPSRPAPKYDTSSWVVTGMTKRQLKDVAAFSDDWSDRNWETQTYKQHNVTPYWA